MSLGNATAAAIGAGAGRNHQGFLSFFLESESVPHAHFIDILSRHGGHLALRRCPSLRHPIVLQTSSTAWLFLPFACPPHWHRAYHHLQ